MPDVIMPRLSDSMQEGTILRWLKGSGEAVERGEELVEIETDKATMIYEADGSGVLTIVVGEGATVAVGAVIGELGEGVQSPKPGSQSRPAATTRADVPERASGTGELIDASGSAPNGAEHGLTAGVAAPVRSGGRVNASPLARRTAARLGVDLATVVGSGPDNRIVKSDVVAASKESEPAELAATARAVAAAPAPVPAPPQATVQELTRTQEVIASRMAQSRSTVPDFELQVDVDMSAAVEIRSQLKELVDPAPSLNDLIVKAAALALRRHPRANGSYREGRFELHPQVNVGIAVATDDALIVPTVFDADQKSVGALASETRRLIERVRSGKITPPELSGGTCTVSNLGMFGVDRFTGIINPPEAAILCVGAMRDRPMAVDGQVTVRPTITMTLACDHRILYGADAARFLNEVRRLVEQPLTMML